IRDVPQSSTRSPHAGRRIDALRGARARFFIRGCARKASPSVRGSCLIIQPIVEGHGEVEAVPLLLRRLQAELGTYTFQIARPIRRKRSELITEEQVRRSVRLALGTPECAGVLVIFDSDDDCPREFGPMVKGWAQAEAGNIPCEVVLAHREYEAWFIAAVESLRGYRGVRP